jgi:hypothetical protein
MMSAVQDVIFLFDFSAKRLIVMPSVKSNLKMPLQEQKWNKEPNCEPGVKQDGQVLQMP